MPALLQPPLPDSAPFSAQGFLPVPLSTRRGPAQVFSIGAHALLLLAVLLSAATTQPRISHLSSTIVNPRDPLTYITSPRPNASGRPSLGLHGSGGEPQEVRPPRHGNLAPLSSNPLAPPRLPQNQSVQLPVPPAVFDPSAPASVRAVSDLGLPWSKSDSDSAGAGKHHGIGVGDDGMQGDSPGSGSGGSEDGGPYANVFSEAACQYCPEPPYTEEARKAKLQGKIILQVLVGADGRAKRLRVLQGLGMGLDERAMETVRGWRFLPARDARHTPISTWVTIETRFQLF